MELYGVQHGQFLEKAGKRVGKSEGLPSKEMLERIRLLPKGSVVGLEVIPEFFTEEEFEEGIYFSADQAAYWQAVVDVCEEQDHEIVYLDDLELYREAGRAEVAAKKLAMGLEKDEEELSSEQIRQVQDIIFALLARVQYILAVERERAIFEKMVIADPDIAVIGIAHGDYLYTHPHEADVDVEAYWQGIFDEIDRRLSQEEYIRFLLDGYSPEVSEQYIRSPEINNNNGLNQREAIIRAYNAVTKGRVLPEREEKPEWIGTWRLEWQAEGLFEIYFEKDESDNGIMKGTIEDSLGTATFEGIFNEREISFIKTYLPNRILNDAAAEIPLHYYAECIGVDEYKGQYGYIDGFKRFQMAGEFIVRKGSYLYEPIDVENLDVSSLLK